MCKKADGDEHQGKERANVVRGTATLVFQPGHQRAIDFCFWVLQKDGLSVLRSTNIRR